MRLLFTLIIFGFVTSISLQAQCIEDSLNMELKFRYDDPNQPGIYNDVWGYVDDAGNEYAIIGASDSILIFDVTNTDNVIRVGSEHGDGSCAWRDMKTWRNTLYAGSECGDGILIFDLSYLPDSFPRVNNLLSDFTASHNIYIDSTNSARLYAVGANSGLGEGMVIYDLEADETNPPLLKKLRLDTLPGEVPSGPSYYIHDIFVKNDTAYCSHGNTGYAIWDVSDVNNINRVSDFLELPTPDQASFSHSSWNTDNDEYAYVATEIGNRQIYIIDQSDKTTISLDTTWKEPLLEACGGPSNNVPHNPYVYNGYLYISYYQDGINILDISNEREPFRVGFYDTTPNNTVYNGTTANWGVYPFLPSGTVIGSDTNNGLYVMEFTLPIVPLQLIAFDVLHDRTFNSSRLKWEIASAFNVREFEIQKQIDGKFVKIGSVPFSDRDNYYEFEDSGLQDGHNIYRLKIIDLDNSFEYSDIEQIFLESRENVSLYPSVGYGTFTIDVDSDQSNFLVYDMAGRKIESGSLSRGKQIMDLGLLPGQYIFKVESKSGSSAIRFTVL